MLTVGPSHCRPASGISTFSHLVGGGGGGEGLWKQQIAYSGLTIWNRSHHLQPMQQRLGRGRAPKGYCEMYVERSEVALSDSEQ